MMCLDSCFRRNGGGGAGIQNLNSKMTKKQAAIYILAMQRSIILDSNWWFMF